MEAAEGGDGKYGISPALYVLITALQNQAAHLEEDTKLKVGIE